LPSGLAAESVPERNSAEIRTAPGWRQMRESPFRRKAGFSDNPLLNPVCETLRKIIDEEFQSIVVGASSYTLDTCYERSVRNRGSTAHGGFALGCRLWFCSQHLSRPVGRGIESWRSDRVAEVTRTRRANLTRRPVPQYRNDGCAGH